MIRSIHWAGLFTAPWFLAMLFLFGALQPGYSQLHRAVSHLGQFGAAHAFLWDLLGFFTTGCLIFASGWALWRRLRAEGRATQGGIATMVLGAGFALTATPANVAMMYASPWTWAHITFATLTIFLFMWAAFANRRSLTALGVPDRAARYMSWTGWLMVAIFLLYFLPFGREYPGLVQRLTIMTVLAWTSVLNGLL
ncbi:MAG: DUF998 domain-containing protein, partial [Gammaproteobacteria bacterium]